MDPLDIPSPPVLESLARQLARSHDLARDVPRGAGRRLRRRIEVLEEIHETIILQLHERSLEEEFARSGEWILDNQHIVAEAVLQIQEHLTAEFYAELPRLADTGRRDEPRVLALARAVVEEGGGHLDPERARHFLVAYQTVTPLTMGELWAFPGLIRLAVLEDLAHAGAALVETSFRARSELSRVGWEHRDAPVEERVPAAVGSLRTADAEDWAVFFEATSRVEARLRRDDPSGAYPRMDFRTRDRYRKAVEELARRTHRSEEDVAVAALRQARSSASGEGGRTAHVGYHLVAEGRRELETRIGFRPPWKLRAARWLEGRGVPTYLGAVGLISLGVLVALLLPLREAGPGAIFLGLLLGVTPAATVAVALVNWVSTRIVAPRTLPKLALDEGIPREAATVVTVPCLLTDEEEVEALARQLELNFQGNRDRQLKFALVGDFTDAPAPEMPDDARVLEAAREAVRALNRKYAGGEEVRFLLFHRPRRWNPAEGVWMGRERKRGKLEEFNRLLLGDDETDFTAEVGTVSAVRESRYVLTLDADTFLPQGAARRLVGVMEHPLNRPELDDDGRLVSGYTVLQPRVETIAGQGSRTLFARVFEVDRGLDLYSHAVSDVYQDLFSRGIFAGKGLYHVAAFEGSLRGRVPDNALLSHDLFEGLHGRVALVTDVMVFEDFPERFLAYTRRLHRWVRGDWQLIPWLLPMVPAADGGWLENRFDLLGSWQIADNLRRSLVASSLTAFLLAGWLVLPGPWWWWTAATVLVLGIPVLLGTSVLFRARTAISSRWAALRDRRRIRAAGVMRWMLGLVFLPYQAYVELDAVLRTLHRLLVSRRHLLEWTAQAHTSKGVAAREGRSFIWRQMAPAPALALGTALGVVATAPTLLVPISPFLAAWFFAPELARHLGRRPEVEEEGLDDDDLRWLRLVARRTWAYFERFVGPDDHWLPPDHFQEEPRGEAAHRTSPTNIGLFLASIMGARDLGYLQVTGLAATLRGTFESMERLERHRGHLLNWYHTRDLSVLPPRYVSTVDSGNLAGALLAVRQGLLEVPERPLVGPETAVGLADSLEILKREVTELEVDATKAQDDLRIRIDEIRADLLGADGAGALPERLYRVLADELASMVDPVSDLVTEAARTTDPTRIARLRGWLLRSRQQGRQLWDEMHGLTPWTVRLAEARRWRESTANGRVEALLEKFVREAEDVTSLAAVPRKARRLVGHLREIQQVMTDDAGGSGVGELREWSGVMADELESAAERARELLDEVERLADRAGRWVEEMDFTFLYDPTRHLFHVGYDVTRGELDRSYYDLLASEARVAGLVAVAKGDVPAEHWLHLGRPFGRLDGSTALLSWAGTAFEYLMPALFTRTPPGSMLELNLRTAVKCHRVFGDRYNIPWGISESAYHEMDAHGTYQYRAFGVPGLAIRRDPGLRLVVAPYASALALPVAPGSAVRNLRRLERMGMLGSFGFYEAVDFGNPRTGGPGRSQVVRSFMAHHQGMIFLALVNRVAGGAMVERFHGNPEIQAVEYLLHERAPLQVRLEPLTVEPISAPARDGAEPEIGLWDVSPGSGRPSLQHLSNGTLTSFVTDRGGGGLRWKGRALTRWSPVPVDDARGLWVYLQDEESGRLWSATDAPVGGDVPEGVAAFGPHAVEYQRTVDEVVSHLSVTVPPGADVEIRRLVLRNEGDRTRRLRLTTFGEVSLAPADEDLRHPQFARLFVEARWDAEVEALVFRRRRRSPDEPGAYLAHAVEAPEALDDAGWWETDRGHFLGRDGSPARPAALAGSWEPRAQNGASLDPAFSISRVLRISPGRRVEVLILTAAGSTRDRALLNLDVYRSRGRARWGFEQARTQARRRLASLDLTPAAARRAQLLLTAVHHPFHVLRGHASEWPGGVRGQEALWGLGISGDHPVVAVVVPDGEEETVAVAELVRIHALLRGVNVAVDLVVLDEGREGYTQPLRDWLLRLVSRLRGESRLGESGGVHHVPAARLGEEHRAALEATAAAVFRVGEASLDAQLSGIPAGRDTPPPFVPTRDRSFAESGEERARPEGLLLDNGLGGFSPDGLEYVIHLEPGSTTPAPWINVVALPRMGFTVSERGAGFTWAGNSGEHRLTPWTNDPVLDPPGEALYLRDEESGQVWTPTPEPAGDPVPHTVAHGAGYSRFESRSRGLDQQVELFVSPEEPAKVVRMVLHNRSDRMRRISATYYAEWVLGGHRRRTAPHLVTAVVPEHTILLARNQFVEGSGPPVAFLASDRPVRDWTCDRSEFLGQGGVGRPDGLTRIGLAEASGAGIDPCGALMVEVVLEPGARRCIHFFLGAADGDDEAVEAVRALRREGVPDARRGAVDELWDGILGRLTVETPDPSVNLLLNRWALYQALSCRLWGRSALYQSSGAFGFRDQLQDALALLGPAPEVARERILDAARRQFPEGDVLHWWHPPHGAGIRSRCSDDLLWLPFALATYLGGTGDWNVLDEILPFLEGPEVPPGEVEKYDRYGPGEETGTLYEHALRALDRGTTRGANGLPLMGSGDWNDGMDRVGRKGSGESVWLGWFLHATTVRFAEVCEAVGDQSEARRLRERAAELRDALEAFAWDGAWYLRGTYDDGSLLGSASRNECQIDSIAQSWAILSGAGDPGRGHRALQAVEEHLVREDEGLVRLLAPPFDRDEQWPGYIKAYPPGVRENGGQYTHAGTWVGWALTALGEGARAMEVFRRLNPIHGSEDPGRVGPYRVEPYAVAGDVCSEAPHAGRGGWTWYTGSAAWMYRLGVEAILGLRPEAGGLRVDPCIPPDWPGFRARLLTETGELRISVENPEGVARGVEEITLDGRRLPSSRVPIPTDGGSHEVRVRLGGDPLRTADREGPEHGEPVLPGPLGPAGREPEAPG